jgi:CheY-like chemotaxis protein
MSSGKIIQFKQPEISDSFFENLENKRRFPTKPVIFFGITESNPVKFFGISEIETNALPEKTSPPKPLPQEITKLPQIKYPQTYSTSRETTKLPPITEVVPVKTPIIDKETIPQVSKIVEEKTSKPDIEQTTTPEEKPSHIDVERITTSDELPQTDTPPTVMVIEDDRVISSFLQHLLKRRGFLTHYAPDGLKALEMFEEIPPPNLIIVDLMLPFLDGFELIKKIRSMNEWANIPIIVVTSKTQEQDLTRAFETGANDYLVKPFRSQELIARVKRFVSQK